MFSQRLKQLRLARGLSLEALAARMEGVVTKQALSKYETGKARPTMPVITKLAAALKVKSAYLWAEPMVAVTVGAYRKRTSLTKTEEGRVEGLLMEALEERVRLQELVQPGVQPELPVKAWRVATLEDVEEASRHLRERWNLGFDPISNVIAVLESHFVHVVEIDSIDGFDGLSAVARNDEKQILAVAVASRRDVPGERQRFSLAHELGHLVLEVEPGLDEEKAANRFASSFLAPAETVQRIVGNRRVAIRDQEFLLLKKHFGISIQALLYRLKDLGIITEDYYKRWCVEINRRSWKKDEPGRLPEEEPQWLRLNVLRAVSEGRLARDDASRLLGQVIEMEEPISINERRAFMKKPLEERRRIMGEQAERMARHYEQDSEWRELEASDLVEH